ncbi:MAG: hypothetical protein AAB875_00605 [Patescibacteria group bacterium]
MALRFKFSNLGENGRMLRKFVLDASADWQVGDIVSGGTGGEGFNGEVIASTTSTYNIIGVIESIITNKGVAPADNGCSGAFVDQYRTAANNETAAQVSALVDISPFSVYSADLDDTIGTTTGSNRAFYYFNLDTPGSGNIDESTALAPSTGHSQFVSHGLDPEDTNNLLVSINRSFMLNDTSAPA